MRRPERLVIRARQQRAQLPAHSLGLPVGSLPGRPVDRRNALRDITPHEAVLVPPTSAIQHVTRNAHSRLPRLSPVSTNVSLIDAFEHSARLPNPIEPPLLEAESRSGRLGNGARSVSASPTAPRVRVHETGRQCLASPCPTSCA